MNSFRISVLATIVAAAVPMTASAFSFGFDDNDFDFGSSSNQWDGPYGRYTPYGPPRDYRGYGPYGGQQYAPRRYPDRNDGPGVGGGGPIMTWGGSDDEKDAAQQAPARDAGERDSRSSWGGRPWSSWGDDDGVNFSQGKTWKWGNSKMDWGNRWRPNFGGGRRPGGMPGWNWHPGWEQYQYGPRDESRYRGRSRGTPGSRYGRPTIPQQYPAPRSAAPKEVAPRQSAPMRAAPVPAVPAQSAPQPAVAMPAAPLRPAPQAPVPQASAPLPHVAAPAPTEPEQAVPAVPQELPSQGEAVTN